MSAIKILMRCTRLVIKQSLIWDAYLLLVGAFLLLGNAPRILPISVIGGSLNAGEVVLYLVALTIFLFSWRRIWVCKLCVALITVSLLSLFVGLAKWGADGSAVIYNIRFVMQLVAGGLAGVALAVRYRDNAGQVMRVCVNLYFVVSLMALVLFFAFPDSAVLWTQLSEVGVEFAGDPNVGRLVSFYFDPNLFGTIIVFPIFVTAYLFFRSGNVRTLLYFFVFLFTLLFTVSRSGLSLFLLLSGCLFLVWAARTLFSMKVSRRLLLPLFFIISALVVVTFAFGDTFIDLIIARFTGISNDGSALARWDSFQLGLELFAKEPLLGYGYNFSLQSVRDAGRIGLDSSLQSVVVNYGLLMFALMVIFLFYWWFLVSGRLKRNRSNSDLRALWRLVILYCVLGLIWAGNFNQILFYPFWIVPMVSLISYVEFASHFRLSPCVQEEMRERAGRVWGIPVRGAYHDHD